MVDTIAAGTMASLNGFHCNMTHSLSALGSNGRQAVTREANVQVHCERVHEFSTNRHNILKYTAMVPYPTGHSDIYITIDYYLADWFLNETPSVQNIITNNGDQITIINETNEQLPFVKEVYGYGQLSNGRSRTIVHAMLEATEAGNGISFEHHTYYHSAVGGDACTWFANIELRMHETGSVYSAHGTDTVVLMEATTDYNLDHVWHAEVTGYSVSRASSGTIEHDHSLVPTITNHVGFGPQLDTGRISVVPVPPGSYSLWIYITVAPEAILFTREQYIDLLIITNDAAWRPRSFAKWDTIREMPDADDPNTYYGIKRYSVGHDVLLKNALTWMRVKITGREASQTKMKGHIKIRILIESDEVTTHLASAATSTTDAFTELQLEDLEDVTDN